MPVIVRVEKFKNLQNKACLPPFLCYLLCPGYFGGDFLNFSLWDTVHIRKSPPKYPGHNKYFDLFLVILPKFGSLFYTTV